MRLLWRNADAVSPHPQLLAGGVQVWGHGGAAVLGEAGAGCMCADMFPEYPKNILGTELLLSVDLYFFNLKKNEFKETKRTS